MAEHITVNAPDAQYMIRIESGALSALHLPERCAVVTNTTLAPLYGERLVEALPSAFCVTMPDGEQYKTLETVNSLYSALIAGGCDRSSTVIALGGGVVGDTAGYVAATYMRGVKLIQIPTSLLAMVDSSVGGKVGVDLPQGKNLVGAFKQPAEVVIDPDVLATLPEREWRCGMAEIIKHGLLADETLLDPALHTLARAEELVSRAVKVKVGVVQRDPYEQGERAHLNLGHTFAHALEQVTQYAVPHGEAVGVGLLAAVHLSHTLGMCDAALISQVETLLIQTGLPVRFAGADPQALYSAMSTDKKWQGGKSRFVLLRGVGQPEVVKDVPLSAVIHVLERLQ